MSRRAGVLVLAWLAVAAAAFGQAPPVTITTSSPLPNGYLNLSYGPPPQFQGLQFTDVTNPSQAATSWSIAPTAGVSTSPPGLTMTSSGFFSGTPTQTGNFTFNVNAVTQYGSSSQTFTLQVGTPQVTITSTSPISNAFVNQVYNYQFTGTTTPGLGITWSTPANALPAGLFLSQAGSLFGTPSVPGQYTIPVTAQLTGTNVSTTSNFAITIFAAQVSILTTSLPVAVAGQGYSFQLLANPAGATWQLAGSSLPAGLNFDTATGIISGVATTAGKYSFAVQASFSNYLSATNIFTLFVTNGPLKILENSLPIAIQGAAYRTTLTPQGGLSPFQWALSGTNALGLTIDPNTGTISGTPNAAPGTSYPLLVVLSDATGTQVTQPYSVFVAAPLSVATTTLPNGTVGTPYTQTLAAAGGQAPYIWSILSTVGTLPPGLLMGTDGVIRGTPTVNGLFSFGVQVTDFGRRIATANLSITIGANITLSIGPASLPDGQPSIPYPPPGGGGVQLTAAGGTGPYIFSTTASALPQGLSLSSTGLLSGTPVGPPTAPLGTSTFTVTVHDSSAFATPLTGQKTYTLNITLPLVISTNSLPDGTIGKPYPPSLIPFVIQASGGQPSYNFSVASGTLPAGMKLDPTGILSGTPTGPPCLCGVTILVQDAGGQTAQKQFTINIVAGGTPPAISTGNLTGTVGTPFSTTLAATGGTTPYTFALTSGTPPAGLTFSGSTLSGTPTAAGTTTLMFSVTDTQQQTASKAITVTINPPPPPSATIAPISGNSAQQPSVSLTLGAAYPVDITGTYSLSFQSSVGGSPTEVQFATGQTATFTITSGQLSAPPTPPIQVMTGTVAGTITITAKLTAGGTDITPTPAPTQTIVIAKAAPVIQSVAFTNSGGVITVTVIGYSTTREIVSGDFVFSASTGNTVSNGGDVPVPLTSAFTTWYASTASNPFGGQFKLTLPFTVGNGTSTSVTSVSVSLTNTVGASPKVSPQ